MFISFSKRIIPISTHLLLLILINVRRYLFFLFWQRGSVIKLWREGCSETISVKMEPIVNRQLFIYFFPSIFQTRLQHRINTDWLRFLSL